MDLDAFHRFDERHGLWLNVALGAFAVSLSLLNNAVPLPSVLLLLKDLAIAVLFAYLIVREYTTTTLKPPPPTPAT